MSVASCCPHGAYSLGRKIGQETDNYSVMAVRPREEESAVRRKETVACCRRKGPLLPGGEGDQKSIQSRQGCLGSNLRRMNSTRVCQ
jgi:hypothetical protein